VVPRPAAEPAAEEDPFRLIPERFRKKALNHEKNGEPAKALFSWRVVHRFRPQDAEASPRIAALEDQIQKETARHFLAGSEAFQKNDRKTARGEFLKVLAYDPNHAPSLRYLKEMQTDPEFISYETREGDTLAKISGIVYRTPELAFLIAYFNDLDGREELKAGMKLRFPPVEPELLTRPVYSKEKAKEPRPLAMPATPLPPSPEEAEAHYQKGLKYFLAEDLEAAIKEWEEALRLNPEHANARKDLEKTRRLKENLKRVP
jgi:tetratricopeptide (TPR) repeat protein